MVNAGSGCSINLVNGTSVERLDGTGLGGASFDGLARKILGTNDIFPRVVEILSKVNRSESQEVHKLIKDIYGSGIYGMDENIIGSFLGKIKANTPNDFVISGLQETILSNLIRTVRRVQAIHNLQNLPVIYTGGFTKLPYTTTFLTWADEILGKSKHGVMVNKEQFNGAIGCLSMI